MIDLLDLGEDIPELVPASEGIVSIPCSAHGTRYRLYQNELRIEAGCGCSPELLLAELACRSARLREWLTPVAQETEHQPRKLDDLGSNPGGGSKSEEEGGDANDRPETPDTSDIASPAGVTDEQFWDAALRVAGGRFKYANAPEGGNSGASAAVDDKQRGEQHQDNGAGEGGQQLVNGGIPFFITQQMKSRLHKLGHSDEQIALLKPAEAHRLLQGDRPSLFAWQTMLYEQAKLACEGLLKPSRYEPSSNSWINQDVKLNREVLESTPLEAFIESINRLRNNPNQWLTSDPEGVTPIEVDEQVEALARQVQALYAPVSEKKPEEPEWFKALHNGNGKPKSEPEEKLNPLRLGQLYSLVDEWDRQPWVWEGILPRASVSIIVGKSETGKSSIVYALIYSVVRSLKFFGRQCEGGRVLYLAGDPVSEIVAGKTFKELGLREEEDVIVLPDAIVGNPTGMIQLRKLVSEFKPVLVIGDTMATVIDMDAEDYARSYRGQQPLVKLAREFKPNFLMCHHSQKSAMASYSVIDAALGTVGIAAVASTRMGTKLRTRRGESYYTWEMSSCRIGQPIKGEWIVHKYESGLCELDGLWGAKTIKLDKEQILERLSRYPNGVNKRTLWNDLRVKPTWAAYNDALDELFASHEIEVESVSGNGGSAQKIRLQNIK